MQLNHAPRLRVVLVELPARCRLCAVGNVCSQNMGSLAPGCKKRVTSSFKKSSPETRPPLPPLPPLLPSSYKANICYLRGGPQSTRPRRGPPSPCTSGKSSDGRRAGPPRRTPPSVPQRRKPSGPWRGRHVATVVGNVTVSLRGHEWRELELLETKWRRKYLVLGSVRDRGRKEGLENMLENPKTTQNNRQTLYHDICMNFGGQDGNSQGPGDLLLGCNSPGPMKLRVATVKYQGLDRSHPGRQIISTI